MATRSLPVVPDRLPLGPDSVYWKVNSELGIFAGGGRALLMQVAHPGVGAGVEQHSSYAADPWGRFFRTVDVMMKLSFGTPEQSARQQRMLEKMHRRVKGNTDLGRSYDANAVDLQMWVWATLVDTALVVYERIRPHLGRAERAQYYEESKLMAYGCGVPVGACPEGFEDFGRYVERVVAEELEVTRSARAVAAAAMSLPVPGPLGLIAAPPHQLITIGLLHPSLREQYGFDWGRAKQCQLDLTLAAGRAASTVLPTPLRRLGATITLNRDKPLRVPWLQRRGAEMTGQRLDEAGFAS
ncbi:MAG: DUF2236 domain-containing protein [Microthrixaceae bacterium]|nr:DUF2236 domain-containing protein [Microthrixaceae bacterium]